MKHIKAPKHKELKSSDLRWQCNPDIFEFKTTDELEPIEGILGQERALNALRVGMDLRSSGYNIYIAGLSGTGKATTVKKILEKVGSQCP
jgi:Cdc6-like AAA superfamily ATPase